ncbi:hypothetical protein BAE44_0004549 [Dichanthelium oligosanthes]|uniref:Uncharacterized protein n=1 Tax=Dichanthelium oligosanthes TaxID=888268 RepID=A0A1E5WAK9_9POAL|nr:hypothetical protein BAE44_0004549 [Dichanthelium oligosanthes]
MAASQHSAIVIVTLLLLASSQSSLVHARMVPRDHPHVHAEESRASTGASPSSDSQDLLQVFTAPPTPLILTDKPEVAAGAAKRRQIIQATADGSVPSPGIGHHGH